MAGSHRSGSVLDRLDEESIEVGSLAIHTPSLDDVFFALTGHATTREFTP